MLKNGHSGRSVALALHNCRADDGKHPLRLDIGADELARMPVPVARRKGAAIRLLNGLAIGKPAADDAYRAAAGLEQFGRDKVNAGAAVMHHHAITGAGLVEIDVELRQIGKRLRTGLPPASAISAMKALVITVFVVTSRPTTTTRQGAVKTRSAASGSP